jgi:hypothetical protein
MFRKFGGLNYAQHNNIISNNLQSSNNLNIPNVIGEPNTKITTLSHIDMSGNSLINVGNVFFSSGGSQTSNYAFVNSVNKFTQENYFQTRPICTDTNAIEFDTCLITYGDLKNYFITDGIALLNPTSSQTFNGNNTFTNSLSLPNGLKIGTTYGISNSGEGDFNSINSSLTNPPFKIDTSGNISGANVNFNGSSYNFTTYRPVITGTISPTNPSSNSLITYADLTNYFITNGVALLNPTSLQIFNGYSEFTNSLKLSDGLTIGTTTNGFDNLGNIFGVNAFLTGNLNLYSNANGVIFSNEIINPNGNNGLYIQNANVACDYGITIGNGSKNSKQYLCSINPYNNNTIYFDYYDILKFRQAPNATWTSTSTLNTVLTIDNTNNFTFNGSSYNFTTYRPTITGTITPSPSSTPLPNNTLVTYADLTNYVGSNIAYTNVVNTFTKNNVFNNGITMTGGGQPQSLTFYNNLGNQQIGYIYAYSSSLDFRFIYEAPLTFYAGNDAQSTIKPLMLTNLTPTNIGTPTNPNYITNSPGYVVQFDCVSTSNYALDASGNLLGPSNALTYCRPQCNQAHYTSYTSPPNPYDLITYQDLLNYSPTVPVLIPLDSPQTFTVSNNYTIIGSTPIHINAGTYIFNLYLSNMTFTTSTPPVGATIISYLALGSGVSIQFCNIQSNYFINGSYNMSGVIICNIPNNTTFTVQLQITINNSTITYNTGDNKGVTYFRL